MRIPDALHYRGMAYYQMSQIAESYSAAERKDYAQKSYPLLLKAGFEASTDELKAASLLYYVVSLYQNQEVVKNQAKALQILSRVLTTRLKKTSFYNDALLCKAEIYSDLGWGDRARTLYAKLKQTNVEDKVYSAKNKLMINPQEAAISGLQDLR